MVLLQPSKRQQASRRNDGLPSLHRKALAVKGTMLTFVHRGERNLGPCRRLVPGPCNLNKAQNSSSGKVRQWMEAPTICFQTDVSTEWICFTPWVRVYICGLTSRTEGGVGCVFYVYVSNSSYRHFMNFMNTDWDP